MVRKLAQLGEVMQLAFVPSDFDAAVRHWTETMGAGPFFLLENIRLDQARYRGAPTDAAFTLALGYWGSMQIELIRPENDSPSPYVGEYGVRGPLHHVCVLVNDIAEAYAACADAGANVVFEGKVGDSGAVIYADAGRGPGGLIELLQPVPGTDQRFAAMRAAHLAWDGTDPLRRAG